MRSVSLPCPEGVDFGLSNHDIFCPSVGSPRRAPSDSGPATSPTTHRLVTTAPAPAVIRRTQTGRRQLLTSQPTDGGVGGPTNLMNYP